MQLSKKSQRDPNKPRENSFMTQDLFDNILCIEVFVLKACKVLISEMKIFKRK